MYKFAPLCRAHFSDSGSVPGGKIPQPRLSTGNTFASAQTSALMHVYANAMHWLAIALTVIEHLYTLAGKDSCKNAYDQMYEPKRMWGSTSVCVKASVAHGMAQH